MGNTLSNHEQSTLGRNETAKSDKKTSTNGQETSRMLFLYLLLNKTWNTVVDSVEQAKGKRSTRASNRTSDSGAPRSHFDEQFLSELEEDYSLYGSQYSFCSCSYCEESRKSTFGSPESRISFCESDFSYTIENEMAPSAGESPPGGSAHHGLPDKLQMDISCGWPINGNPKENQRPPVYNPEDYVLSLKKYGRKSIGSVRSIYDTAAIEEGNKSTGGQDTQRASTLPGKNKEYRSPIPQPPESDCEMSLRQFGSITDLLTKLRADLRASFPSFVQEFVATPMDGVSLLLDVLRAIQLSQSATSSVGTLTGNSSSATIPKLPQSYQRRALLDELACLQCISICCSRSPEAGARLGSTPVGLLPIAASATGQGIRSRIFALQLLTTACDKTAVGNGTQRSIASGHGAVSEALSTLRLRCGEPVRFRLLVGMLNSGGGSGELQAVGLRFLNTFLESAENTQNRLYLQAELFQAGFEPSAMTKTISSSSPWLERLRVEVKHWDEIRIDVDRLIVQAREAEKLRSQLIVIERRAKMLHEEKNMFTLTERRLQDRCADLQREIFRLQNAPKETVKQLKDKEKRPVALPRLVPPVESPCKPQDEDEGISSSETGQSLSPEPSHTFSRKNECVTDNTFGHKTQPQLNALDNDDVNTTIEDVIEELQNIVIEEAQKDVSALDPMLGGKQSAELLGTEHDIVPVNLLPQPPRKSRSLLHLFAPSDLDGSDYELLLIQKCSTSVKSFFEEEIPPSKVEVYQNLCNGTFDSAEFGMSFNNGNDSGTNRALLNVIMDAREKEEGGIALPAIEQNVDVVATQPIVSAPVSATQSPLILPPSPAHFNGVFFMADMNSPQRYPRPDLHAALEAKRVTKHIDRMDVYNGLESMIDIVVSPKFPPATDRLQNFILPGLVARSRATSKQVSATKCGKSSSAAFKALNGVSAARGPAAKIYSSVTNGSKVTDLASGLY